MRPDDYPLDDLGIYAGHDDILSEWGSLLRTTDLPDYEAISKTVSSVIYGIFETPGAAVDHIQLGNIIAHILHNHGGFHRRPNC